MNYKFSISMVVFVFATTKIFAQYKITGNIKDDTNKENIIGASITLSNQKEGQLTNAQGNFYFTNINPGIYFLEIRMLGYTSKSIQMNISNDTVVDITLDGSIHTLNEVVVSGSLKETHRLKSITPIEVYQANYLNKFAANNLFEATQNMTGINAQSDCNVFNTGSIRINGMEGPYTMFLIDGIPILSSMASVFGFAGIPKQFIERIEVVRGPSSTLFGSEAVGGVINIITKNKYQAPTLSAEIMSNSWLEHNVELGYKYNITPNIAVLTGVNYFLNNTVFDNNKDNFTDIPLQNRLAVFQKWNITQNNKLLTFSGRYLKDERWGGQVNWKPALLGSDSVYAESMETNRLELISLYQLPTKENMNITANYNYLSQNGQFGSTGHEITQHIAFAQYTWNKQINKHDILTGATFRLLLNGHSHNHGSQPSNIEAYQNLYLPGIFIQDEIALNENNKILIGSRLDYHSVHKEIISPRLGYKWNSTNNFVFRINAGTGYRVVNVMADDHSAMTGDRQIEIKNNLKPENSYNVNINIQKDFHPTFVNHLNVELSSWYTYFTNKVNADFDTHPNKIIYDNVHGYAESKGISANINCAITSQLSLNAGLTVMETTITENKITKQQALSETTSANFGLSYYNTFLKLKFDYTSNLIGPMRLPLLGNLDPRSEYSPWYSIQNVQVTYDGLKNCEFFAGVKNLLNFLPTQNIPFLISRSNDPFDKSVVFDANNNPIATPSNPYALNFDTKYAYTLNQGIRMFVGFRYSF